MNFFKSLIADDTGAPSTMRMLCFLMVVPVVGIWTWLCVRANAFVEIPPSILGLIGSALVGKVAQSFSENFSATLKPSIPSIVPSQSISEPMSGAHLLVVATLALSILCGTASAQTITVAWNSVPGAKAYRLGIGTNSRNYQLTEIVAGTNAQLQLENLAVGTNYLAVQVYSLSPTNSVFSRYGNEISILNVDAPALRLIVTLDTSTNLTVWTRGGPTAAAIVSEDQTIQYFRPWPRQVSLEEIAPPEDMAPATLTPNPLLP